MANDEAVYNINNLIILDVVVGNWRDGEARSYTNLVFSEKDLVNLTKYNYKNEYWAWIYKYLLAKRCVR